MSLTTADFGATFAALWTQDPARPARPYPWQQRLVDQIWAEGRWPDQLDLPTGAGKTSALDIALFLLALEADKAPEDQRFPRRIFLVVDRRTIVDQGYARAQALAERLRQPRDRVLIEVRRRLLSLFQGAATEAPVATAVLRGAMVRDDSWARRPDQPLLALSTVDQVGSRLLFRGYGVSDGMKPIHAGLLSHDALFLLDEVHLSLPFAQTLAQLQGRALAPAEGQRWTERWMCCHLSATPRDRDARTFQLNDDDRAAPALKRRLEARKPAALEEIPVTGEEPEKVSAYAEKIAGYARELARPGDTVGVIVNRVETARQVAQRLVAGGAEVGLITGRMRPLDRQQEERRIGPWVDPARATGGSGPARYVVATQCVEAGADYDLDGLVTECAPLDALRQRVGRLNRSGLRAGARAVVVARKDQLKAPDPVYGDALRQTWAWLQAQTELDFGITALQLPDLETLRGLLVEVKPAPLLLPCTLDLLCQTSPVPDPDPDIALLLHGPQREASDVSVIWRADLDPHLWEDEDRQDPQHAEAILRRLEAAPPGSLEALPLPIGALKRWLNPQDRRTLTLSDAGAAPVEEEARRVGDEPVWVYRWRGDESGFVTLRDLRPGDTIVLPASRGGLSLGTFDPASREPVPDLGDAVQRHQRGRWTLRTHPALLAGYGDWGRAAPAPDPEEDTDKDAIRDWLRAAPDAVWGGARPIDLNKFSFQIVSHDDPPKTDGSRQRSYTLSFHVKAHAEGDTNTDPETSSHTGARQVRLDQHLPGVAHWAATFARRLGLPEALVRDLEQAGAWHDLGKLDARFQRWLHDGNPIAARRSPPLAKSATPAQNREARERARERSGYPKGARHEALSLALLQATPGPREGHTGDWDLVCHLVSSHHGFGRPFLPVVADPSPVTVAWEGAEIRSDHGLERLDSGVSDRYWALVRRYGAHRLAYLEALLRLADHHRSRLEQEGEAP